MIRLTRGTVISAMAAALLLVAPAPVERTSAQGSPARWAQRAPLIAPNSETGVALAGGRIFVVGGYPSTRAIQATVQTYDPALDGWGLVPPLPRPLHHVMAAGVGDTLYVIGGEWSNSGFAGGGPGSAVAEGFANTVYAFDPATGGWAERAPMPTERSAGAAAVLDGKIYVAGGRPPHGRDFAVYDPAADVWTALPDLPTQRNHLAAAAIGGKIYVAGGRFGAGVGSEMTGVLEVYDPESGAWGSLAPMPTPRGGVNGIGANGCFYTFGGEGNDADPRGVFSQVELYDPTTDTWRSLEPLPVPIHGVSGLAVISEWIHLPGGGTMRGGSSGSTLHQVFHLEDACA